MIRIVPLLIIGILLSFQIMSQDNLVGKDLPAWEKGYLDIHHINTGRGSCAYFIFPDGTTVLLDAGEMSPVNSRTLSRRNSPITPDSTLKPYEWIVHYIKKVSPPFNNTSIDYGLITHFHDDHFGAWYPSAPASSSGRFALTGITGVGEKLPIRKLIDRGYPTYDYPKDLKKRAQQSGGGREGADSTMINYLAFIEEKISGGMSMATLTAGSRYQLVMLREPETYPGFYVQNIKSNQWIWTGKDSSVIEHFPKAQGNNEQYTPDENSLSLALTFNYGPFVYYTGGDNPGNVFTGDNPLRDVETPIAKAIGEVDVATMDHHGNRDAVNETMVRMFRPTVWIGQTWSSDHPGHEVLHRITNQHIYEGKRDLFATNMLEANRLVIGPLIDRSYKSQQGHIVVRVMPGGERYFVIILDDSKPAMHVKAVFGPYDSKKNKATIKTRP